MFVREHEANEIERFHCLTCEIDHGLSVMKAVTNSHRHDRTEINASSKPIQAGSPDFIANLKSRHFDQLPQELLTQMRGQALSLPFLTRGGFKIPILIESKDGLDISLPDASFSLQEVVDVIGHDHVVDVIDSRRQMSIKMSLEDFIRYASRATETESIYNCISLEVTNTPLGKRVKPPAIVSKLSWVDRCWPKDDSERPSVAKYCLLSMADSYTDFHVDFGGTSVWYHVVKGSKVFFIIEPTDYHLQEYEKWMNLKNQSEVFLADTLKKCFRLEVKEGNTLLIPSGWIHSVLTPTDSIVFGGNFLHSLDMKTQLMIRDMELRMQTPNKFQFPYFEITHWYAAPLVLKIMRDNCIDQMPPKHLVEGTEVFINALIKWSTAKDEEGLYPLGFDCRRMIKDLKKILKKASKKLYPTSASIETMTQSRDITSSDSERELIVDETENSKDSSKKPGVIRMKLSLCGKGGLPEVTEAILPEESPKKKQEVEQDQEILDMIEGRPEDEDYIYLDVESDPEDEGNRQQEDYSWNPRAKVVIRGTPKEARPVREHAKREVIESCIAGAAARLEQQVHGKRKRREVSSNLAKKRSRESSPSKEAGTSRMLSPTAAAVVVKKKGEKTPKQRLAKLLGISRK